MELKGKAHFIGDTESVGANGFTKRLLVIETEETYPQKLPIEFVKEKAELLNNIRQGQEVTVSVNIRGNEYQDRNGITRFGLSFQGWKID
jgi:hypothetical protein